MPLPIPPPPSPKQMVLATEDWVEYRTGFPTLVRKFLFRKVPPTGWFHTLGSSLLTVFILQATTGALLAMTYDPSPNGAYESIRYITDQQTLGWLIRGMHKWGASVMVILLFLHMGRTFFYGAYKYPREMTWLTGSLIFLSVMGMGLTGYLLVWDQRAYWASVVACRMKTVSSELPRVCIQPVGGTLRNRNLRTSVGKPLRYSIQSSVWRTICFGSGAGIGIG